jgi:hypothetical protein
MTMMKETSCDKTLFVRPRCGTIARKPTSTFGHTSRLCLCQAIS